MPMDIRQPAPPRLRDISAQQWRSGTAAWLGWFFDGLDMHLYTLVATPFVAQLMSLPAAATEVQRNSALIQGAFLFGWAIGGGFFGVIGDRLGRSRALVLTILTYACFTGLSFFVQTWWQLAICRFLAALGVGGEWAVGAALLVETWPRHLAALVGCGTADRGQRRSDHRHRRRLAARRLPAAHAVPGRIAAGAVHPMDQARRSRDRGVAACRGPRSGGRCADAHPRPVRTRRAPRHAGVDGRVRRRIDRALGLHVLAPPAGTRPVRSSFNGTRLRVRAWRAASCCW